MPATMKSPTPQQIPMMMVQKMYVVSRLSLMEVRNRTMDSAPTMPRDNATLFPITVITMVVRMVSVSRVMLNLAL